MTKPFLFAPVIALLFGMGAAHAQSYNAPAGEPAVTEPGGMEGIDGRRNVREGIRDGEAVGVPPGAIDMSVDERGVRQGRPRRVGEPD